MVKIFSSKIDLNSMVKKEFIQDCYSAEMEYFKAPEFISDQSIRHINQSLYFFE
jgi:hypothetical protein